MLCAIVAGDRHVIESGIPWELVSNPGPAELMLLHLVIKKTMSINYSNLLAIHKALS